MNEELDLMLQADELARERLDRRGWVDSLHERNSASLEKSRKLLASRKKTQTFISAREDGLDTLGAIDGNMMNPFRVRDRGASMHQFPLDTHINEKDFKDNSSGLNYLR